jgi:hexosaminidase
MRILFLVGVVVCLAVIGSARADDIAVVPNPASVERSSGSFALTTAVRAVAPFRDQEALNGASLFATVVRREQGLKLHADKGHAAENVDRRDNAIVFIRSVTPLPPEGYRIRVAPRRVTVEASDAAGFIHGATTLSQLARKSGGITLIPAVMIEDSPRFRWRGLMLDSARHFQSTAFVKKLLDVMAMNKLNVLHWHLTDDQSWRLEIRKYPKLTSVGAWRVPAGQAPQKDIDPATGKPRLHGGFYTQAEVKEVIAHATFLGITVVPEIEMPGHAAAALVAYPEYSAMADPPKAVPADWGVYHEAYKLDAKTTRFLEDVLDEVIELFPSKYIHVGGDEVDNAEWKAGKLQGPFTVGMAKYLASKGRRLVGWDEILEPGLPNEAVVMSWRGIDGGLKAAAAGHDTILAAYPTLYFDNRQSGAADEPPGRGKVITLKDVYAFEPMPGDIDASKRGHVLGLQGQIWTEHVRTEERVAHMLFPRSAAVAELGWSKPERRDWNDFLRRLSAQLPRYAALGFPVADSAFAPRATVAYSVVPAEPAPERLNRGAGTQVEVALANAAAYGDIRYTLDGSDPTVKSPRYRSTVKANAGATLKAAAFDGERRISAPRTYVLDPAHQTRRKSQELKLCTENISLSMEDDAPIGGHRAALYADIQSPCWIYEGADLAGVKAVAVTVGQLPYNYQIGELIKKVTFPKPETAVGELEVRLGCEGELLARLPLAPAASNMAITALPAASIAPRTGKADLCMRFAQPTLEPMWMLDSLELVK